MLPHPPSAREASGTRFPCSYRTPTLLPTCKVGARDRALRWKIKLQGVCDGSEKRGRFPLISKPKGQAHLRKQARNWVTFSPSVQLLLPSSEQEEDTSISFWLPLILRINAAHSGLGTEIFSPVPGQGIDPSSAGQPDPEAVTSPWGSAVLVPPIQAHGDASRTLRGGFSGCREGKTGWGDKLEEGSSAEQQIRQHNLREDAGKGPG